MLADGRFWLGVIVGAAGLYGYFVWRQRRASK